MTRDSINALEADSIRIYNCPRLLGVWWVSHKKVRALMGRINFLIEEYRRSSHQLVGIRKAFADSGSPLDTPLADYLELRRMQGVLSRQLSEERIAHEAIRQELVTAKAKAEERERDFDELRRRFERSSSERATMVARIGSLDKRTGDLEDDLKRQVEMNGSLNEKVSTLCTELAEVRAAAQTRLEEMVAENDKNDAEIGAISKELKECRSLCLSMAERIRVQSELLSKKAERAMPF